MKQILGDGAHQKSTRRSNDDQPHHAVFSLEEKKSNHRKNYQREHRDAAKRRQVMAHFVRPCRPDGNGWIVRLPQCADGPDVELLSFPFRHGIGQFNEAPRSGDYHQHAQKQFDFLDAEPVDPLEEFLKHLEI